MTQPIPPETKPDERIALCEKLLATLGWKYVPPEHEHTTGKVEQIEPRDPRSQFQMDTFYAAQYGDSVTWASDVPAWLWRKRQYEEKLSADWQEKFYAAFNASMRLMNAVRQDAEAREKLSVAMKEAEALSR